MILAGWQGWLQLQTPSGLGAILFKRAHNRQGDNMPDDGTESVFLQFAGALVAVEVVKILLSLENSAAYGLEFDLSTMRFERYKGNQLALPASHALHHLWNPGLFPGLITTPDTQQAQSRVAVGGGIRMQRYIPWPKQV